MLDIFNIKAWGDFLLRGIFSLGVIAGFVVFGMQAFGWDVAISIPTIEHSFKK